MTEADMLVTCLVIEANSVREMNEAGGLVIEAAMVVKHLVVEAHSLGVGK